MRAHLDQRTGILLALAALSYAAFVIAGPASFSSLANLQSMLLQASVVGILALAVGVTLLSGGIDLSVNAVANLSAIAASLVMTVLAETTGALPATLLGVLAGFVTATLCGALNGVLIAYLRCTPILATLGSMMVFVGIGTVITRGDTFFGIKLWAGFARAPVLGVPVAALVFLLLAATLSVLIVRTLGGQRIMLVGTNARAARFSGIPITQVLLRTYVTSGFLAGVAGLLSLSISNSVNVDFGSSYLLLAVLIAVLGGIAPEGGSGKLLGVVAAVLLLQVLSTGLNTVYQSSSSNFLKEFAWGVALLAVLALGRIQRIGGWQLRK